MNNPDRIHDIMDHIDPALLQQGDALAKRPISRIGKAAIIAACLCALLIGGTFAAEYLAGEPVVKLIGTNPVTGEEQQGFYTIIEPAENASDAVETPTPSHNDPTGLVTSIGVPRLPVSLLSEQVQALAAGYTNYYLSYTTLDVDTWEDAEELLGLNLMDNYLLSIARKVSTTYRREADDTRTPYPHCRASVYGAEGNVHGAEIKAQYMIDDVTLYVQARLYTEYSRIATADMFGAYTFREEVDITTQPYASPNGLRTTIVTVTHPDGTARHFVQFAQNSAAFTIEAVSGLEGDHALATLREVLNAFQ